jgi:peptide/nickel transport system permease protein
VLGLTAWTGTARVIRAKTLQLRELEFVTASRALGQSTPSILLRHVLPNVVGVAIVLATNSVATMIVAEAALSFLGLSIPPPAASWGRMLDDGRPYATLAPWLLVAPAIAILLAVLGFNLLGEGLRDAFDPKDA